MKANELVYATSGVLCGLIAGIYIERIEQPHKELQVRESAQITSAFVRTNNPTNNLENISTNYTPIKTGDNQ